MIPTNRDYFSEFADAISAKSLFQKKALDQLIESQSATDRDLFNGLLGLVSRAAQERGEDHDVLVRGYLWFCQMVRSESMKFLRTKRYSLSTFEEARNQVYSNPQIMKDYMNGLAVSQAFWPAHRELYKFYLENSEYDDAGE